MRKTCYINQPAGLGDILFCLKLAQKIKQKYNCEKIIWPVHPFYKDLQDYIVSEDVYFTTEIDQLPCNNSEITETDSFIYVPLSTSDRFIDHQKLKEKNYPHYAHGYIKYLFANVCDWSDWQSYFEIKRNLSKENELFKKFGLKEDDSYVFVNRNFGTFPNFLSHKDIHPKTEYKIIEMFFSENHSIFDWLKIIEKANEIHTVETSICYLIEKLNTDNKKFIYSRLKHNNPTFKDDFVYIKDRTKIDWIYN